MMKMTNRVPIALLIAGAVQAQSISFVPKGADGLALLDANQSEVMSLAFNAVGEHWSRVKTRPMSASDGNRSLVQDFKGKWGAGQLTFNVEQVDTCTIRMKVRVRADKEVRLVGIGPVLMPCQGFREGTLKFETAEKTHTYTLPLKARGSIKNVIGLSLPCAGGGVIDWHFEHPIYVHLDVGEARLFMLSDKIEAGQTQQNSVDLAFPEPVAFEPANRLVDTADWFPLQLANDFTPGSALGMDAWLEKPAGRHGFARMKADRFVFEDGKPVKFWGVNACTSKPTEEYFDQWAARLAKYGVNLVRNVAFAKPNHKNKWAHYVKIQDTEDGMNMDPGSMKLFDYGFDAFKRHGIYVGMSPFYGWYPTPGDKQRLIAHHEMLANTRKGFPCTGSYYALTCIAPDVQDCYIDFTVKVLNHVNPHTGMRYADDPALAFVELMNEENIYLGLWNLRKILDKLPTYKKIYYAKFADWLKAKYGSRAALAKAWGNTLKPDEDLDQATVDPCPAWFQQANPRIADQLAFIYADQRRFYQKFADAVRATGYRGLIDGSCWQACNWQGHLYNVMLDRSIGFIDRHNYGGSPMLRAPGTALLSFGMQQVADRPFNVSEWAYGLPVAEEVPLMAVYGMGLQGWDGSQQFASHGPEITPYYERNCNHTCDQFENIAQYPAVARMIYRGDVKEGAVAAVRKVSIPTLLETGNVGFTENFSLLGNSNHKEFSSVVPQSALAAGRVTLDFIDGPVEEPIVKNYAACIDTKNKRIASNTGQLIWDHAGRGYFTVDTPGTQAIIGFAGGKTFNLGEVKIELGREFACLYITARDPGESIAHAKSLLITAMARTVNKGTVVDAVSLKPLENPEVPKGQVYARYMRENHPLLLEPVQATITLKGNAACRVFALDHDGRKHEKPVELPVAKTAHGNRFTIDGEKYGTLYYLVERK